jgi:hypothetical protein
MESRERRANQQHIRQKPSSVSESKEQVRQADEGSKCRVAADGAAGDWRRAVGRGGWSRSVCDAIRGRNVGIRQAVEVGDSRW